MRRSRKRILSVLLAAAMVFTPVSAAYAEEEADGQTQTADDPEAQREAERQAAYKIAPDTNSLKGWPQGPAVYGDSAIVMDMDSGAVLFEKQADKKHYPASITKILTTLVALENAELTDKVEFTEDSISFLEYGDASIGMTPGEVLSMEDALYAVLLASANEVSYAVAESTGKLMGGDYDTFIQEMNKRAAEIGCTGSHWTNANGLHDEEHYTTAHDMAVIASEVYQYEEFQKITQTLNYTIGPTNLVDEDRVFQQNHKMLWPQNANYYEYCTGGKTGYTDQARTTLVTMADNGDLRLAAVVLYDFGNDAYIDTREMFDYAFDNFSKISLTSQEKPEEIESFETEDPYVLLPRGIEFSSLEREYKVEDGLSGRGTVTYTYEGQNLGTADVVLTKDYITNLSKSAESASAEKKDGDEAPGLPLLVKIIFGAAAAVVILFVLLIVFLKYRQMQRRKLRRARRMRQNAYRQQMQQRQTHRQRMRRDEERRPRPPLER